MFYVYVLKCSDGSFYTGYTNDLKKRFQMHMEGKASKYTRSRLPVEIVGQWIFGSKSDAMRYEIAFKSLLREEKIAKISERHLAKSHL